MAGILQATFVTRLRGGPEISADLVLPGDDGSGRITTTAPLPAERRDGDRLDLPRIMLQMNQFRVGGLHRLIRALNALASAQTAPVSAPSA